jgi:hypothetical protein
VLWSGGPSSFLPPMTITVSDGEQGALLQIGPGGERTLH